MRGRPTRGRSAGTRSDTGMGSRGPRSRGDRARAWCVARHLRRSNRRVRPRENGMRLHRRGRDRHRKRATRRSHPRAEPARVGPLHRLRLHGRAAQFGRMRAFWPREGRVIAEDAQASIDANHGAKWRESVGTTGVGQVRCAMQTQVGASQIRLYVAAAAARFEKPGSCPLPEPWRRHLFLQPQPPFRGDRRGRNFVATCQRRWRPRVPKRGNHRCGPWHG